MDDEDIYAPVARLAHSDASNNLGRENCVEIARNLRRYVGRVADNKLRHNVVAQSPSTSLPAYDQKP